MEIKSPYPVAAPEKQPVLIARKGRFRDAVYEAENEVKEVALPNRHIEDIVDISANDVIRIDLTDQNKISARRGHYSRMNSAAPEYREKGALIDVWV